MDKESLRIEKIIMHTEAGSLDHWKMVKRLRLYNSEFFKDQIAMLTENLSESRRLGLYKGQAVIIENAYKCVFNCEKKYTICTGQIIGLYRLPYPRCAWIFRPLELGEKIKL